MHHQAMVREAVRTQPVEETGWRIKKENSKTSKKGKQVKAEQWLRSLLFIPSCDLLFFAFPLFLSAGQSSGVMPVTFGGLGEYA